MIEKVDGTKGLVKITPRCSITGKEIPMDEYLSRVGLTREELNMNEDGTINNMIVRSFHYVMSYLFVNSSLANNSIYLAVGNGSTPVTRDDTQLVSEIQRVVTTRDYNTTYALSVIDPEDATRSNCVKITGQITSGDFDINELGLFWGDKSSTSANTGKMMSRVVTSRSIPKLPNVDLEFVWIYIFRFND